MSDCDEAARQTEAKSFIDRKFCRSDGGADGEIVEQDTVDNEDVPDVLAFVIPNTAQSMIQLSFDINRSVFEGWVKQPSACCGAASIAGVWNALFSVTRSHQSALNHVDVLNCYSLLFMEKITRLMKSFERRLGSSIWDLLDAIKGELKAEGKVLGGKKESKITKKSTEQVLIQIAMAHAKEPKDNGDRKPSSLDCIIDLFILDGVSLDKANEAMSSSNGNVASNAGADAADEPDNEDADVEIDPILSVEGNTSFGGSKWDWVKDMSEIVHHISGLKKLNDVKASTAPIGNWAILQVALKLAELSGLGSAFQAKLLLGMRSSPKQKLEIPLSKKDAADTVIAQWNALRAAFSRPGNVLVFHLKNHYALIFALREYTTLLDGNIDADSEKLGFSPPLSSSTDRLRNDSDSILKSRGTRRVHVRQILCARKGQRPTAWLDFEEAREVMLGWEGYKIIKFSLLEAEVEGVESAKTALNHSLLQGYCEPEHLALLNFIP